MLHKGECPCGPCQEVRGRERAGTRGWGNSLQLPIPPGQARLCNPGALSLANRTIDHVAFRWCACGSPHSWYWACTSLAPTQAKLLKDLL